MKLGNEILLQYNLGQVISVAHTAKKLFYATLMIKLASSSVGERIFRDLISEIYEPSEEKTSTISDGKNGKFIALK